MAKKSVNLIAAPMSTQVVNSRAIRIRTMLSSSDFVAGFKEARAGKPFDYARHHKLDSWSYERGRQLAIIYSGPLKNGRAVTDQAIHAYKQARMAGEII